MKVLAAAFIMALLFSALAVVVLFGTVRATDVTGIISSDTTWTKANSPYSLTGPTAVGEGVTLTIEPGATVNINTYYMQVNGTLIAIGSNTEKIQFNGWGEDAAIIFTPVSNGWNEQTGHGCVIEHAILKGASISSSVSLKISNNEFDTYSISTEGASVVTNNIIASHVTVGGSTIVTNNILSGWGHGGASVRVLGEGSPVISNNRISGTHSGEPPSSNIGLDIYGGSPIISNNIVEGTIAYNGGGSPVISNNTIIPPEYVTYSIRDPKVVVTQVWFPGITFGGKIDNARVINNVISGGSVGIIANVEGTVTIEENLICNNTESGIESSSSANLIIRNNAIVKNHIGIKNPSPSSTISYNNIINNYQNIVLSTSSNINVAHNWWGTTDTEAISQSIFDFEDDFNLGTVTFVPILTEPNPEAPEATVIPAPNPFPAGSPTPTPTITPYQGPQQTEQLETIIGAAIVVAVIGAGLGLLIYLIKRK